MLRHYLNLMSLEDLPFDRDPERLFELIRISGYQGVQFVEPATPDQLKACEHLDLGRCGSGRVNKTEDVAPLAARFRDEGLECATVHAGWGMEDDAEAGHLIEAILRTDFPLYVETHRATIFQDIWRTVQFVKRFPELRFNGDFSHWYTGLEMVYGGFEKKIEFIRPVLDRVRFLHGRIGNPGCIQVDIGDGDPVSHPYVAHFRELWTASMRGFLADPGAGDHMLFVPELLSSRIYYARAFHGREESDRWAQSRVLCRIAEECFASAAG